MPVISNKITLDNIVYTDHWHSYDPLDVVRFSHHRINHSSHFADGHNHINGIENFWNQAKRILRKYNGIDRKVLRCLLKNVSLDSIMNADLSCILENYFPAYLEY